MALVLQFLYKPNAGLVAELDVVSIVSGIDDERGTGRIE